MAVKTFTTGSVLTASDTNTYLANAGLVYVTGGSLTGNTVNVSNCFTSTYKDYRIIFDDIQVNSTSGATSLNFYLRSGTTNTSAGFYYGNNYLTYAATPTSGTFGGVNNAMWNITYATTVSTQPASMVFDLLSPQLTLPTQFIGHGIAPDSSRWGAGEHQAATSFDGFSFQVSTGSITMTGRYAVYGYRIA